MSYPFFLIAQAQNTGPLPQITNINGLVIRISSIGNVVVYLLTALAVVYIVYSTVQYFIKGKTGDESRREAGMQIMWGIIGLAIIISIWGLVNILLYTFATNTYVPQSGFPNANFINNTSSGNPAAGTVYQAH